MMPNAIKTKEQTPKAFFDIDFKKETAFTARHELKYLINKQDAWYLKYVLSKVLKKDKHYPDGSYYIRSLYFDDVFSSAFYSKLAGIDEREKFRIRFYNFDKSHIALEKKIKKESLVSKQTVLINEDMCLKLQKGEIGGIYPNQNPLMREFYAKMRTKKLAPSVLVDYTRTAFVHEAENTRITIDENLKTALAQTELFNEKIPMISVLPEFAVLEIKYDKLIPSYILGILGSIKSQRESISKFALCKDFITI